jgi:hypothetical protein
MRRAWAVLCGVWAAAAHAELPAVVAPSRVEPRTAGFLVLGGRTVGVGLLREGSAEGEAWGFQADVGVRDAFLQLMAARQVRLVPLDGRAWHAAAQLGLDVAASTRGPQVLGLGPNVGLSLGAGPAWLNGFGTLQAGVEAFPLGGPPLFRVPLRAGLGAHSRLGAFDLRFTVLLGLDVNVGQAATARTDAVLALGFGP